MSNLRFLEIKRFENYCYRAKIFPYGRSLAYLFQMGVRGLIGVDLGVLDMKKFGNHCSKVHIFTLLKNLKNVQYVSCLAF